MNKKTVIIAWRFNSTNNNYYDTIKVNDSYEIIKFYTPTNSYKQITENSLDELNKLISSISSDLFTFIHTPQFNNYFVQLLALNKPEQNIHIIGFSGGLDYVYTKFIDQNTKELNQIDQDSFTQLFEEMTTKYGQLESLIHLRKLLYLLPLKVNTGVLNNKEFTEEIKRIKSNEKLKLVIEKFLPNGETVTPDTLEAKIAALDDKIIKLSTTR